MSETNFEKSWESKLSNSLDKIAGKEIRKRLLEGSEKLVSGSSQKEIIDWTKKAMERLDALVDELKTREITSGCARLAALWFQFQFDEHRHFPDSDPIHDRIPAGQCPDAEGFSILSVQRYQRRSTYRAKTTRQHQIDESRFQKTTVICP